MTTIAYRDGIIAYDSRTSAGDLIISDDYDKMSVVDGVRFFWTGATSDMEKFLALYFGNATEFKGIDAAVLSIEDGKLYNSAVCKEDGFWKHPISLDSYYAKGSGSPHAFTAMDMGATAKEAVRMAAKRDKNTGGRIRTFKVK